MSSVLDRLSQRAKASPMVGGRELEIPLDKVRFDPKQPRKAFHHLDGQIAEKDDAYIAELAATIQERGLIQAITVQEMDDGSYLVVVGECRTRAHLLLGLPTIRAVVRNDLTDLTKRLLYQVTENVTRQDLTDEELALSVRILMQGGDGLAPMSQVRIAKAFGKGEGWVSRMVRFGDEELQRLWYKPGIVDSAENLYRVSILPKPMQVDILSRVALPEGNSMRLEKPLERKFIDQMTLAAKVLKNTGKLIPTDASVGPLPLAAAPAPVATSATQVGDDWLNPTTLPASSDGSADANAVVGSSQNQDGGDLVRQALTAAALDGSSVATASDSSDSENFVSKTTDGYALPAEARAAVLGAALQFPSKGASDGSGADSFGPVQAPVNCRVSVASVQALLAALQSNSDVRSSVDGVQCDLIFPGFLAQSIANQLSGVIVDHREVPSVLQRELAKLH